MLKFEIGTIYATRSACDHDCKIEYECIARTAQTVTLRACDAAGAAHRAIYGEEIKKLRISPKVSAHRDAETVYPWGVYSMSPSISADMIRRPSKA